MLHAEITDKIIKAFYHVYNTLGYGFLEKVYQNALVITLRKWGLNAETQLPIGVAERHVPREQRRHHIFGDRLLVPEAIADYR